MLRINDSHINVIGDSLDACLASRNMAESGKYPKIVHYVTKAMGGVFKDDTEMFYLGLMQEQHIKSIKKVLPKYNFVEVTESYIKIPNKKLCFQNSYDGYVRFPFTIYSFENEYDYDDMILKGISIGEFMELFGKYKNINKVFKEVFHNDFFMNIVKKIGNNIWQTSTQTLDPMFVYKSLLQLDSISSSEVVSYFRPDQGYTALCQDLLNHPNITVIIESRENIKRITRAQTKTMSYYCEYYDYYLDFIFGGMEYIVPQIEIYKKNNLNVDNYVKIQTPYDKDYGMYYQLNDNTLKTKFNKCVIDDLNFSSRILSPTMQNKRKMLNYTKRASLSLNIRII